MNERLARARLALEGLSACAAGALHDFASALWRTVTGLGDRDTTCAMVGGVVAGVVAMTHGAVPSEWQEAREPLPA